MTRTKAVGPWALSAIAFAFAMATATPAAAQAETPPAERCTVEGVQRMAGAKLVVDTATPVAATSGLPAYCAVRGHIDRGSRIGIAAALPAKWNGKFLFYGIGGFAGVINPLDQPPQSEGLIRGYATATTDTGHQSKTVEDATWALDNPAALINHFDDSVDLSAQAAKGLVAAFYGRVPSRSYFDGCSAGGRQAIVEAERFPTTFDGIVAAAPAWHYSALLSTFLLNARTILRAPANWISPETFAGIDREVLAQCDGVDGQVDTIIMDPRRCRIDLGRMLCKPGVTSTSCLTPAQIATLQNIIHPPYARPGNGYFGYRLSSSDRSGPFFGWPDWMFGTHSPVRDATGRLNFATHVLPEGADRGRGPAQFLLGEQFFRYMVMNDPRYDGRDFDPVHDLAVLQQRLGPYLDADRTDLGTFVRAGGKLLIWHGWADGAIPPEMSIDLYQRILRDTKPVPGQIPVDAAVRLFMVPGVQHCSWGAGLTQFDTLTAIEQWVEQGRAPERIDATQLVDGKPARSRPLCRVPKQAVYRGSGNPDDAASFDCR